MMDIKLPPNSRRFFTWRVLSLLSVVALGALIAAAMRQLGAGGAGPRWVDCGL
jgi:hypothetical protein